MVWECPLDDPHDDPLRFLVHEVSEGLEQFNSHKRGRERTLCVRFCARNLSEAGTNEACLIGFSHEIGVVFLFIDALRFVEPLADNLRQRGGVNAFRTTAVDENSEITKFDVFFIVASPLAPRPRLWLLVTQLQDILRTQQSSWLWLKTDWNEIRLTAEGGMDGQR